MQVDNLQTPSLNFSEYNNDFEEFLNLDLFASANAKQSAAAATSSSAASGASTAASSSSRASSPQSPYQALLQTPPDSTLGNSFPSIHDASYYGGSPSFNFAGVPPTATTPNGGFFNFLDEDMKTLDPSLAAASATPFNFYGNFAGGNGSGASTNAVPFSNLSSTATSVVDTHPVSASSTSSTSPSSVVLGIDPQLVGTPSAIIDEEQQLQQQPEHEATQMQSAPHQDSQLQDSQQSSQQQQEKLTFTLPAPVKVGGHGKARKGTVQSGGIVKKTAPSAVSSSPSPQSYTAPIKDKENVTSRMSAAAAAAKDEMDDDDDIPADWRPPPEVLQKMTSKEKRQLRNKISARNFRVRRKEYISTLEMDIAERDRLLQAIRSELGSTQSENVALRQEIMALKKALLDGRSGTLTSEDIPVLNLPPPGPIPPISTPSTPSAASASTSSPALVTPNTQKDLPQSSNSPRLGAFWGGVPGIFGGGATPVHTVLMPETNFPAAQQQAQQQQQGQTGSVRAALQENINPALNGNLHNAWGSPSGGFRGFEGFVDTNPFTMKTLDAYRMQLWNKMAAQQQQQHPQQQHQSPSSPQQQSRTPTPPPLISSPSPFTNPSLPYSPGSPYQPLHGLAASLKHLNFSSPKPSSSSLPPSITSGKSSASSSSSAAAAAASSAAMLKKEKEQQQQAIIAAVASQTLVKKLTGAFWDAFTGSSSSSPSTSASSGHAHGPPLVTPSHFRDSRQQPQQQKQLDVDKVRRVLEGKAVVKIVDVEPTPTSRSTPTTASMSSSASSRPHGSDDCGLTAVLEESMRSLTLGKK